MSTRDIIAKNIAAMLHDGDFVNLGVGIPTLVGKYIPEGISVILHGENGSAGLGAELDPEGLYDNEETLLAWRKAHQGIIPNPLKGHKDLANAGGNHTELIPGAACFDSLVSFAIARGGHLDMTVLGGMQVDEEGNLANWKIPGKRESGMGGAMDLVAGTKQVIVAMEHCAKGGTPKLLKRCTLPLTGAHVVDYVVTELCILRLTDKGHIPGFEVIAMAPSLSREELQSKTDAPLHFAEKIDFMISI